jgi:hypothetical protein
MVARQRAAALSNTRHRYKHPATLVFFTNGFKQQQQNNDDNA